MANNKPNNTNEAKKHLNIPFEEPEDHLHFCSDVQQLIYDFNDQKDYTNMTDYLLARLVVAAENISYCVEERAVIESLKDDGIDSCAHRREV